MPYYNRGGKLLLFNEKNISFVKRYLVGYKYMNMRSRFLILVFLIFFLPLEIFASSGLRITEEKGFFALPLEQFNLGVNPTLAYSFWFKINENSKTIYQICVMQ